jgi:hypothetical protein
MTILGSDIEECGQSAVRLGAGTSASIERCLLHDNTTAIVATSGATLDMSHVTVYASTVGIDAREESAGSGGGHITADSLIVWNVGEALGTDAASTVSLSFSDVDGSGVPPGTGNINADPRFARPSTQDFRISYFSPCRGAGKDGTDMGAFPYEPLGETGTFMRCDTNNDGENDLSDGVFTLLNLFAGGIAPACPASSDCNVDGAVDLSDVVFSLNYLFLAGEPPPPPYPGCDEAALEDCPGHFCPGG